MSLSNQKCIIQPTLINLHPNKYSQEFHYYSFLVKLDGCDGNGNTLNDLYNNVCALNKTENLNLSLFDMIIGINESETLTKHKSWESKCRNGGRKTHNHDEKYMNIRFNSEDDK